MTMNKKIDRSRRLSQRQQRMMDFIYEFWTANSYAPTIAEIGNGCGIASTSVTNYNLNKLQKFDLIKRDDYISRSIRPANIKISFE